VRLRRIVIALVLWASGLSAPVAAREFPLLLGGGWKWAEKVDPITDVLERTALATTTRVGPTGLPSGNAAGVLLGCAAGAPSLSFLWNVKVTTKQNWRLEYRFAGKPGHALTARYVNRAHLAATSLGEIRLFLAEAAVSENLLVRVTSDAYSTTEARFRTPRGKEMVNRFLAACPIAASSR
jgi:hypothetical protein